MCCTSFDTHTLSPKLQSAYLFTLVKQFIRISLNRINNNPMQDLDLTCFIQRLAKVDAPGCVNAAGKLGRSDKLQQ